MKKMLKKIFGSSLSEFLAESKGKAVSLAPSE